MPTATIHARGKRGDIAVRGVYVVVPDRKKRFMTFPDDEFISPAEILSVDVENGFSSGSLQLHV